MTEKYTNEDVQNIIENEGLGYAVQWYMSKDSIEDEDLAYLWGKAKTYLDLIEAHLNVEK